MTGVPPLRASVRIVKALRADWSNRTTVWCLGNALKRKRIQYKAAVENKVSEKSELNRAME